MSDDINTSMPNGFTITSRIALNRPADLGRYIAARDNNDQINVLFGWADKSESWGLLNRNQQFLYMTEALEAQPAVVQELVREWVQDLYLYLCKVG